MPNPPENTAQNFPGPLFSTYRASAPQAPRTQKAPEGLMHDLVLDQNSGGIEILVTMATKGDIDPKNIDIIDVTDRFLKAIAAAPKENLRQSGKIIFHASVLLRMKAEALLITKLEDLDTAVADDFLDFEDDGSPLIYDSKDEAVGRQITLADLQKAIVRQARQRQSRHRRVTLEQLIESLREAERLEKQRMERQREPREEKPVIDLNDYHQMNDMEDILDLAHDEDIEDVIARVDQLLAGYMQEIVRLALADIIKMLNGRGDWVDAFLAVLFLSNSGKLTLEQDIFYGPLYVTKGENPSVPEPPEGKQLLLLDPSGNLTPVGVTNSPGKNAIAILKPPAERGAKRKKQPGATSDGTGRRLRKESPDSGSLPADLLSLLESTGKQLPPSGRESNTKPKRTAGRKSNRQSKSGESGILALLSSESPSTESFSPEAQPLNDQCTDVDQSESPEKRG